VALALVGILLIGAVLRFEGQLWDGGTLLNPDERAITLVAHDRLSLPTAGAWGSLLDPAHSPLNPRRGGLAYHYGTLPLYLATAGAALAGGGPVTYLDVALDGRSLAALADLLTVLLVFAIGQRVYGAGAGLVAAALSALAVLQIQIAHFLISEPFLVLCMTGTLYCSVVLRQTGSSGAALGAGLSLGLALACKASVAPFALVIAAALWLRDDVPAAAVRKLLLAGGSALAAWLVGDPYALLDIPTYVTQLAEEAAVQSGRFDVPYTLQYVGTIPVLYQAQQLGLWGLGPAAGTAALVGLGVAGWRAWRGGADDRLLMIGFAAYAVTVVFLEAKWLRYLLPLVPILCVFAGGLLTVGRGSGPRLALRGLLGLALLGSAAWAAAFAHIYTQEHTRVAASRWLVANAPAGAGVSAEGWDDRLPLPLPGQPIPAYRAVTYNLYDDRSSPAEFAYLQDLLAQTDVLVLSSNRLYKSIPRLPWRYPVQIRFYELLFAGQLGFTLAHTEVVYPMLGPWTINDDAADESFTVYDHPKVLIFRKTRDLAPAELQALFADAVARPSVASRQPP
jgi:4-amino-4-deoxy-L-arabinose transferase-like glycosyltransferase